MILPSYQLWRDDTCAPRLVDWGFKVTVCIAALCEQNESIVLAADTKVSFGDFSSDMAVLKIEGLFSRWLTLFAGEDTEHIPFILARTQALLSAARRRKAAVPSPAQVANALQRAYEERLDTQIEAKVLRRYGFTAKSFSEEGKKKCTVSVYNGLCAKIADVKLSLRFLMAGFDTRIKVTSW